MDFILTSCKDQDLLEFSKYISISDSYKLSYKQNHQFNERELISEDDNNILLSDTNISFKRKIDGNTISKELIEKNIKFLVNGYVIFINKNKNDLCIYTDIFGYYHLFYTKNEQELTMSSDFNVLLNHSDRNIDDFSILDIILFNYTLFDRTIISDIKRTKGGSKIEFKKDKTSFELAYNFADNFVPAQNNHKVKLEEFTHSLSSALYSELDLTKEINLTMTAGFDSRALLAACKNLELSISTFTFGQKGNIEQEITKDFINKFSFNHSLYNLDENYTAKIITHLKDYISHNMDNPVVLDLPHYNFIKHQLHPSNLVAGFMGGEFMLGQSVGAQVTFTQFAADLLQANSYDELQEKFRLTLKSILFINENEIRSIEEEYLSSLIEYLYQPDNTNVLRFLINEKYSKFFGAVNKVFKNHSNLIVPFMNSDFISYILNSNISFLNKKPFVKNPLENMKAKIFYAKSIKYLYPELADTKFDRLYTVNDLCIKSRMPKAAYGYLQSHLFKKNKKMYSKPIHYDLWYRDIIINQKLDIQKKMLNSGHSINKDEYNLLASYEKKKLANYMGISVATDLIRKFNNE